MANNNRNWRNSRSTDNWDEDIQGINDQYGRESSSNRNNTNYGLSSNRTNRNTQSNYNTQGTSYNNSGNFGGNASNYNRGRYEDYGSGMGYDQQNRASRRNESTDNYSDMGRGSYRNTGYGSNQSNYGNNMNTGYGTSGMGMGYGANSGYGNRNERAGNSGSGNQNRSNTSYGSNQRSGFGGRSNDLNNDRGYGGQRSGFGGRSNMNLNDSGSGYGSGQRGYSRADWDYNNLDEDLDSDYGNRGNASYGNRDNSRYNEDRGGYTKRGDNYTDHNYNDAFDDYDQRQMGTQGSYRSVSNRGVSSRGDESLGYFGYGGRQSRASNPNTRHDDNSRGTWDRTRDEISSWFGDEDARRRRDNDRMNEQYEDDDRW